VKIKLFDQIHRYQKFFRNRHFFQWNGRKNIALPLKIIGSKSTQSIHQCQQKFNLFSVIDGDVDRGHRFVFKNIKDRWLNLKILSSVK